MNKDVYNHTSRSMLALAGAISGVVATGPMTVAMLILYRQLPRRERYSLPPRQITMHLAREAGVKNELSSAGKTAVTLLAHFGYGGAAGGIYGSFAGTMPGSPATKGILFGLAVWAASYLGLLPATGLLTPATEHPARRTALMIVAHVIWGMATGLFTALLHSEMMQDGDQSLSTAIPRLPHVPMRADS